MGRFEKNSKLYKEVEDAIKEDYELENKKKSLLEKAKSLVMQEKEIDDYFDSEEFYNGIYNSCLKQEKEFKNRRRSGRIPYSFNEPFTEQFNTFSDIDQNTRIDFIEEQFLRLTGFSYFVDLLIVDPRVNHYDLYGPLDDEAINGIKKMYNIDIKHVNGSVESVSYSNFHIGFTIYNCKTYQDITKLHTKHVVENKKRSEYDRINGVLY